MDRMLVTTGRFSTLVELLKHRAEHQPDSLAFRFLLDGESDELLVTYGELDHKARSLAAILQQQVAPGERALLLYPPSLDYIIAFFGCLYANVIAVPAYPPHSKKPSPRIQAVVQDSQASVALTTDKIRQDVAGRLDEMPDLAALKWIATDLVEGDAEAWHPSRIGADTLAFLQYTSGSTSTPKGVMVSHGNLLHNLELIRVGFRQTPESVGVVWLPPYHDMGLIGGILTPLYVGYPMTLLAPIDFLQRPFRWLQAVSRYKATTSGGPNFAYEMCTNKITEEQLATLDLSRWSLAFNGAEPVRQETLERFADRFAPAGFRAEAVYPCYGLAESTLFVTGKSGVQPVIRTFDGNLLEENEAVPFDDRISDLPRTLVSSGTRAVPDAQEVWIVDPMTLSRVPDGRVGEIWVAGKSVAQGYWNRPEQSEATFQAYEQATGEGPFLRTGDLGFFQDGELFVTGRLKDLIIIRGRNYYPQDLEFTVESAHPAIRSGCVAAFAREVDGEEQLIVAAEVERLLRRSMHVPDVIQAVRQAVLEEYGLPLYDVVLLKTTTIPKTSSGKIQRHACKARYLENTLDVIGSDRMEQQVSGAQAPEGEQPPVRLTREMLHTKPVAEQKHLLTGYLQGIVAQKLRLQPTALQPDHPIDSLGVASLAAVDLSNQIEHDFDVAVPMEWFLQDLTLAQLAENVWEACRQTDTSPPVDPLAGSGGEQTLSYAQQALWFQYKLDPNNVAYNLTFSARVTSTLNETAFRNAFGALFVRHAVLNTAFVEAEDGTVQRVQGGVEPDIRFVESVDWTDEQVRAKMSELALQPFDLQKGPLLRVHVLKRSEQKHELLVVLHHILADFWSLVVLMDEFRTLYEKACGNGEATLPDLAWQYADFVNWQFRLLAGERGRVLEQYWIRKLADAPKTLPLPTDRPRPAVRTFRGQSVPFALRPEMSAQLKRLAQTENTTLYTLLLAAFQLLLARYSGQTELLVGSPTVNRRLAKVENTIGFFANPVVLRADLSDNPTFRTFLKQVRKTVLEALEHQDYPFARLVENMHLERDLSYSPLFQVMFVLQSSQRDEGFSRFALGEAGGRLTLGSLELESVALPEIGMEYDLKLVMAEEEGQLLGSLQYSTDLFEAETIRRMSVHFERLLEDLLGDPDRQVTQASFLTEADKHLLLETWNETAVEVLPSVGIHQLFERQADKRPDAVAVVFEDRSVTYGELNARANRLARQLKTQGLEREQRVGICMDRSLEMIVSMLATLKAGGAYVPLDPKFPRERLSYMVQDASVRVLLTQQGLEQELDLQVAHVIAVDDAEDTWADLDASNLDEPFGEDQLAYLIYTSGSTGQPKGVMVQHDNVVNFFVGMDQRIGCMEEDTLLAVTSISFDISVLELFWTLTRGAKVVLLSEVGVTDAGVASRAETKSIDFSLFYFANDESEGAGNKYELLIEGAKFADQNGFSAIWTPERHFHQFGGLYPSPAVVSSAIAMVTERIKIRAGSVVLPLHHPVRVVEDWSVVDQLSNGRVGMAFASGWHADDFVLMPDHYRERSKVMFEQVDMVKRLWRGESVPFLGGVGNEVHVQTLPRPVQAELPFWVTSGGNRDTFIQAGKIGANLLTHLLGQSVEDLAEKIALYRQALVESGHDPRDKTVSLMMHTFIGESVEDVREKVKIPFTDYLRSSVGLIENLAKSLGQTKSLHELTADDQQALLEHAFERYFKTSALFGTPESCMEMVNRLKAIGVDEICCLIDFGVEKEAVIESLKYMAALKERSQPATPAQASGFSLPEQAVAQQATLLQCTPSLMQILLQTPAGRDGLRDLRAIMLGGEALPTALAHDLKQASSARLFNMYGPTETTVWSTTHEVDGEERQVPIGRPIANTEIYILDEHMQPVAIGAVGELYIGGRGVTRGYLDRPELTEERFLPHPFRSEGNARLYKTGDLARYRADGTIEYLGRRDFQVKIRGFRIELEEIERLLEEQPDIRQAVVHAVEWEPGDKRLVAYLKLETGTRANESAWRQALKERLPDYMVPSYFVLLDEMPLTQNGKVDRKNLPTPDLSRLERETAVAPQTATEKQLALIWEEFLQRGGVGRNQNFFDLGGHSLLATQVLSRIHEAFPVSLSMREFFAAKTLADLATLVEQKGGSESALRTVIPKAERSAEAPLSFAQERIWFFEQFVPGTHIYHEATRLVRMRGDLNVDALQRSFDAILARHESLRTTFAFREGQPVQRIADRVAFKITHLDLSELSDEQKEQQVAELGAKEVKLPFDLSQGPLLRATLIRLAQDEHLLMLTLHHIVADGWALGVLIQELSEWYGSYVLGTQPQLPELPIQYADYSIWQREQMNSEAFQAQLAYWKEQLQGDLPVLQLPTDRMRPPMQTFNGATQTFTVDADVASRLGVLAQRQGSTLFIVLLAAFKTLLYRYTGQTDLAVGTLIANRNHQEVEPLIGVLINTLVMRSSLEGNPTFTELLAQVKDVAFSAYQHQDVPFERIVEALKVERDLSFTPLFQVMFIYQNTPKPELHMPGIEWQHSVVDNGTAKFDLTLIMEETNGTCTGTIEYNSDLFDAARIRRMVEHFSHLLEAVSEAPDARIGTLPLLSDSEKRQLLTDWQEQATAYPLDRPLHWYVEQQVDRTPHHTAAIYGDQTLTYAELDRRANQLAHYLRTHGVDRDVPVGICVERSLELVVGLLAILKAGGAYLPIDPEAPTERKRQLLEDAQSSICLVHSHLLSGMPQETARLLCVDRDEMLWVDQPTMRPQVDVRPDDLVSLYYTSGSTGKPKGVANLHIGWVNRMLWMQDEHRLQAGETVLQKTTLTFDDSAVEFFWPLMVGGRIALLEPILHKDPQAILDAAIRYQVAVIQFVPSVLVPFLELVSEQQRSQLQSLRHVISSGETLRAEVVRTFFEKLDAKLHNQWGPTEVSIDTTLHTCSEADSREGSIVPIGKPIANHAVYILDPYLNPVPFGVMGELYIAGVGLARGYLNNRERTEEAFLQNPYRPGETIYKTGDRGFFRPDGSILFLGRLDDQVKIRGLRVELGEVEATIGEHPGLQEVAVVAHDLGQGDKRLVAFVVKKPDQSVSAQELRDFVKAFLPEYMVPSAFVELESMPLTPNGKADRKQLVMPDLGRDDLSSTVYEAPRNAVEEQIAAIFADVLKIEKVGIHDSFFDLGGHSLLATHAVNHLRETYLVDLPLRAFFETPTVANISQLLQEQLGELADVENLDELLNGLDDLSDEEIEALLLAEENVEK